MAMLNVYFARNFHNFKDGFAEEWQYATSMVLMEYLGKCLSKTSFTAVDYWWDRGASYVTKFDFVCYMHSSSSKSIVARAFPQFTSAAKSSTGTTVQLPSQAVVSEVYLDQTQGDANRHVLLGNLIFHELMHNVLDATDTFVDVHTVKGGVIARDTGNNPLTASDTPSAADFAAMNKGLKRKHKIVQHTADMP